MKTSIELPEKTFCLCGSIKFAPEMKRIAKDLTDVGKTALLPKSVVELDEEIAVSENYDKAKQKLKIDAIRVHIYQR